MLMPPDLHRVGKYRTGNSFVLLYHIEENDRKGERNLLIETNSTDVKNYLKYFLRYLQNNLCKNMKLSELKEIKIVNRDKLPRNVDARSEGNTVFLSYQSIIAAMDRVGIQNIQQCLEKDIEQMPCEITYILNNLYHELCHMEERTLMPNIHKILLDRDGYTVLEKLVAHFWIEFVVECKSGEQHFRSETTFCNSFISAKWEISYLKGNREDTRDLYWLMYTTPYFISLCYINNCFDDYIKRVSDIKILSLLKKLYTLCVNLYTKDFFDSYNTIKEIGIIFEETFNTKTKEYEMLYM